MTRSRRAAAASLLAAALAGGCAEPETGDVILVTLDTVRADRLGAYGYAAAATPTLDAIAAAGTVFDNAVCHAPLTTPSHASILTGLLPYQHGVRQNGTFALPDATTTLAERLARRGYQAHAVLASFAVDGQFGLGQGFHSYDDELQPPGEAHDPRAERPAGEVVDRAIALLERHPSPLFLWLHLYDPHHPYAPPPPFDRDFADRPYDGELAYLDRELGRLVAHLQASERWRDALVVVVADHGEALGEHGERYHGTLLYEPTVRVPLLIKWPGRSPAPRAATPVGGHDIVPTVLAAVGAAPDPDLPGTDLRAVAAADPDPDRLVYVEALTAELQYGWARLTGLRGGRFKLIRGSDLELYDLGADPGEARSVAQAHPEVTAALAAELLRQADQEAVATAAVDADDAERLAALGYLSAGGSSAGARALSPAALVELENRVLDAVELMDRDAADAAALLRAVLAEEPGCKLALLLLAQCEERLGRPERALAVYEELVRRYPDVEVGYAAAVRILGRGGRLDAAVALAARGLDELGSDSLRVDLAFLELKRHNPDRAWQLAAAVDPAGDAYGNARYVQALVAGNRGDPDALRLLREAIDHGHPLYPVELAAEPAFATIRDEPEFLILLESSPSTPR